ncbi:MAG TPA: cellulase family glycosylhydrolase [Planctomycetaceae bacterium]|nr:cellulase family glycosylhydrolase [Planctomycetaceae bacterium]
MALFTALTLGASAAEMERIRVSDDKRGFALEDSGRKFTPWGFNYDHDERGRLIEDYWENEWQKVVDDFGEMRELGANVVRIHLQLGRVMKTTEEPDRKTLERLAKLVALAEETGLYLDLTGLGCYHKQDVPAWYDKLSERERWNVQARFWQAVAEVGERSPAIFCYDLMNEPVVPGGDRQAGDWLGPPFAGKHFVQFIGLSQQDRPRPEIARRWIKQLAGAIRKRDTNHLVTVGLVDWSLDRPGLTSGFVPSQIEADLDFLCVHLYPKRGKIDEALKTLEGFCVGKPVVIEETFPLHAPIDEFEKFIDESSRFSAGWIGFYWGKTIEECKRSGTIGDAITRDWLELFVRKLSWVKGLSEPSR